MFLLTNTHEGYRYSLTGSASKSISDVSLTAAYTFGSARDLSNGVRNSPQSNFEFNQVADPRNPALTASNFDVRQRVVGSLTWDHEWKPGYGFGISGIFTGVSGSPFTFTYASDANRDGAGSNDLIDAVNPHLRRRAHRSVAGDTRSGSKSGMRSIPSSRASRILRITRRYCSANVLHDGTSSSTYDYIKTCRTPETACS